MFIVQFCEIIDDDFIEKIEENGRTKDWHKAKEMRNKLDQLLEKNKEDHLISCYHLIYDDERQTYD